jgi:glycosyltransferase involved in cell wall biosynthesis
VSIKKRVLVLTSTFPRWQGDSEPPFVFELSRRLADRFDIMVLAPHAPGAKRSENIGNLEVHRFRYFFTPWQSLAYHGGIMANLKQNRLRYLLIPLFLLSEFVSLVLLLRKHRVDVIHAHWLIPQGLVAIVARALFKGVKPAILCTSHGTDMFGLTGTLFKWLQKKIIAKVDKLTVVSTALRVHAISLVNRDDIEVIPMGIDLTGIFTPPVFSGRNSNELLFVGRLVEQKGLQYLIQAMPEILRNYPQVTLTIAGDGPEREYLRRLADVSRVGEHVQFLGAVENAALKELYRRAAMFVSPSLAEGFGLVFVEALGCACPVVATGLPAIRDVVIDGVTGLTCQRKNGADLAAKVCFLFEHPELREKLGSVGRLHVQERFDWATISHRYAALIDELAQRCS